MKPGQLVINSSWAMTPAGLLNCFFSINSHKETYERKQRLFTFWRGKEKKKEKSGNNLKKKVKNIWTHPSLEVGALTDRDSDVDTYSLASKAELRVDGPVDHGPGLVLEHIRVGADADVDILDRGRRHCEKELNGRE
jgi:hypothetical protein